MDAVEIDDVPALRGCPSPLRNDNDAPESEGMVFDLAVLTDDDGAFISIGLLLKCHFSIFFFRKLLLTRDLNSAVIQERENSFRLRHEFLLMGIH